MPNSPASLLSHLVADYATPPAFVDRTYGEPLFHTESEVLVVELRNQPGALAHVCEQLAAAHINIEYAYCSSGGKNGKVFGIFKVSNSEKAIKSLSATNNAAKKKGWIDQTDTKGLRLTTAGENYVDHDLPGTTKGE